MSRNSGCLPVAAIILAAGAATRMGKLKQLLIFQGQTLLAHCIRQAREAEFSPIILVVGAESNTVRSAIASQPIEVVQNDAWTHGMGSSIAVGMARLQELETDSAAVAILLADQPLVKAHHLSAMRKLLHSTPASIVAAYYGGTLGVPALFKRTLFSALLSLPPESGARHLLRDSSVNIQSFALPEAAADVDTPEDFDRLPVA